MGKKDSREVEFGVCGDVAYSIWEINLPTLGWTWNTAYVAVPPGHPWHGKNYDEIEVGGYVHGGLTFSDKADKFNGEHGDEFERLKTMNAWLVGVDWNHHCDTDMNTHERRYSYKHVLEDARNLCGFAMQAACQAQEVS